MEGDFAAVCYLYTNTVVIFTDCFHCWDSHINIDVLFLHNTFMFITEFIYCIIPDVFLYTDWLIISRWRCNQRDC